MNGTEKQGYTGTKESGQVPIFPYSAVQNDVFLNNKVAQYFLLVLLILIFFAKQRKGRMINFRSKIFISCLLLSYKRCKSAIY
jgi:hypothetical protein